MCAQYFVNVQHQIKRACHSNMGDAIVTLLNFPVFSSEKQVYPLWELFGGCYFYAAEYHGYNRAVLAAFSSLFSSSVVVVLGLFVCLVSFLTDTTVFYRIFDLGPQLMKV